ncbi:MAG: hypothetical protein HFG83_14285 [Dorea sp.]|nr:hypothetical protein [Dorea sp.]
MGIPLWTKSTRPVRGMNYGMPCGYTLLDEVYQTHKGHELRCALWGTITETEDTSDNESTFRRCP